MNYNVCRLLCVFDSGNRVKRKHTGIVVKIAPTTNVSSLLIMLSGKLFLVAVKGTSDVESLALYITMT